jgi:very-short-patch-repair endonuclease
VRDGIHFPYNPHNVERAKKMRKNMTDAESKVRFGYLRKADHKRYRQKCIDHFIVDFYCPEVNLVLEIDGDTHA